MDKSHKPHAAQEDALTFLRQTANPYIIVQIVFVAVVLALSVDVVARGKAQWDMLLGPALMAVLVYVYYFFFGRPYRVAWTSQEVCMYASGIKPQKIRYQDIAKVVYEIEIPRPRRHGKTAVERPARRIAIYRDPSRPDAKFVDVSLKHFALDDIRVLLREIARQRPDLELPKNAGGISLE